MDRQTGGVTPDTAISSMSTASSPHSNNTTSSSPSKIHMSDNLKIGSAADAAAIAYATPLVQLLKMSEVPQLREKRHTVTSPQEMVEKDPLHTAMWRLYRSSATFHPESVRTENITWRMMAMTLKKNEK
jgi:GATA-binding protein, other eukaryote